jgi:hypothetical protein
MTTATGHVVLRGAELVLSAERARGAADAGCVARCLVCRAESGMVLDDAKAAAVWALRHAHEHGLDHGQFLVVTRNHWRVSRRQPVPAAAPPVARARHRRRRHRRTPAVLAALVTAFRLLAGPLFPPPGRSGRASPAVRPEW